MNTKLIMSLSALMLGITGIALTFVPDLSLLQLGLEVNKTAQLLMQIIGALYFSFAMLNWMSKGNLIGGIYSRPIALANFTHFFIIALALLKLLFSATDNSPILWSAGMLYSLFGLLFGKILFTHPLISKEGDTPSKRS